jgi:hypothetical protein
MGGPVAALSRFRGEEKFPKPEKLKTGPSSAFFLYNRGRNWNFPDRNDDGWNDNLFVLVRGQIGRANPLNHSLSPRKNI